MMKVIQTVSTTTSMTMAHGNKKLMSPSAQGGEALREYTKNDEEGLFWSLGTMCCLLVVYLTVR